MGASPSLFQKINFLFYITIMMRTLILKKIKLVKWYCEYITSIKKKKIANYPSLYKNKTVKNITTIKKKKM